MKENITELPVTREIRLEVKKYALEWRIDPNYLNHMIVEERMSEEASAIAIRVILMLAGREVYRHHLDKKVVSETSEIGYTEYPATWWDGLKFALLQSKWLRWTCTEDTLKNRIKYQRIPIHHTHHTHLHQTIEDWHLCPLPDGSASHLGYCSFLSSWTEPFRGSQQEYVMLTDIASEAKRSFQSRLNLDTSRLPYLVQRLEDLSRR